MQESVPSLTLYFALQQLELKIRIYATQSDANITCSLRSNLGL